MLVPMTVLLATQPACAYLAVQLLTSELSTHQQVGAFLLTVTSRTARQSQRNVLLHVSAAHLSRNASTAT